MKPRILRIRQLLVAAGIILLLANARPPEASANQRGQSDQQTYLVYLNDPTDSVIAERVKERYQPQLEALSRQAQAEKSLDAQAEGGGPSPSLLALQEARRQMRQEMLEATAPGREASQAAVEKRVLELGGEVLYRYQVVNALAVRLPEGQANALAALPGVVEVAADRTLQPALDVSVPTILNGSAWTGHRGVGTRIAVIDTGITQNHPALSSNAFLARACLDAAPYAYDWFQYPITYDYQGHGTHIAGIVASDLSYIGVAKDLDVLINAKAGYLADPYTGSGAMQESDSMACADWAVSPGVGADVLNLSWGGSAVADGPLERFWDALVDQWDAVATIAAGNSGPNASTLGSPAGAYNVISVANVDDGGSMGRAFDFINTSSSRGPTIDGRKKPDLAAPGTLISSTDAFSSGFVNATGTSMAAPHVAGAASLLMSAGVYSPKAVKAILINNAQDKGMTGWDNAYGWGYIDLNEAYWNKDNYFLGSVGASPDFRLYAGPTYAGNSDYPYRATLVWHRRAVYNGANPPGAYYTLTNLDLFAYDEATNNQIAASNSAIDNVEQLVFNAAYPGAVIKVDTAGGISGASGEDYALATRFNFSPRSGPSFHFTANIEGDLSGPPGTVITMTVNVGNSGDLKAFNIGVAMTPGPGLTKLSGPDTPPSPPNLAVGASAPLSTWSFTKTTSERAYVLFTATSVSYGETFQSMGLIGGYSMQLPLIRR